jgi:general secretion pathway protein I
VRPKCNGFTLIECLVALLILSIVLASATRSIGVSVQDVRYNYTREAAMWAVSNQLTSYLLNGQFPDAGVSDDKVTMAGMSFTIHTVITATTNQLFRKIYISAYVNGDTSKPAIYTTTSFLSQY